MKRTIEPDDPIHCKCKRINNNYKGAGDQTKPVAAFEEQLQRSSHLLQVDGTADDGEADPQEKINSAKQSCGTSVAVTASNNPVSYNCASSALVPPGMMSMRSEQNAGSSSEVKPIGVMPHQPFNGIRSTNNLYSYPNFLTLHQAQQQQQLRPPQQYQVVTGLPLSWNSGDPRKMLPTDFDPGFRMQHFPRVNFQNSSVSGQLTPTPTMLDVRLCHPSTSYTMIPPHSIKVAGAVPGASAVHSSLSNLVPFGSHTSHVVDNKVPVASSVHHVQTDTGKAYLLGHGSVSNKSVTHEQGQWLTYPVKKQQGTESLYRPAASHHPLPQQIHVVQSKPELPMPYSVNSFLNTPVRCVVAGNMLEVPKANSNTFWNPVSSAMTANKLIPFQDKMEQPIRPYFHTNMISHTPQLMPSNISHHQKLHSFPPQSHLYRPAVDGSSVNNVISAGSSRFLPSSELSSFQLAGSGQMQVSDSKPSNILQTGMPRKQYQFAAENSLTQQALDVNSAFYRSAQPPMQPAIDSNKHQSSETAGAGWNQIQSAGADFKTRAYEQLSAKSPSPNAGSSSKVLPATADLPEPPDKPPTEDPNDAKYIQWHKAHQEWLHTCITGLEGVIAVHKRKKKWLTTKEKTAQKAGRQLSSIDLERLATATEEHSKFQQQLFAKRKELRSHQTQNETSSDISQSAAIKLRNIFVSDEICPEKQAEPVKREKPVRRPSSLKLKQKSEESTRKVDSLPNADDDPLSILQSLPQLTLQHPDVTAVPDSLLNLPTAAGKTVLSGSYGSMLIKDLPSEYDLPAAVKSDPLSPETKDVKDEVKTQDVTATLSVTLTLTTSTTDHVSRVLDAIADLLKIAVPPVFEIQSKSGVEEAVKVQSLIAMRPKFCRHCSVVIAKSSINSVKHLSAEDDSKETSKANTASDWDDGDAVFCSIDCRMEFSNAYLRTVKTENCASDADSSTLSGTDTQPEVCSDMVKCDSKSCIDNKPAADIKPPAKRLKKDPIIKWKNKHYKMWSSDLMANKPIDSVTIINDRFQFETPLHDTRRCILCNGHGDGVSHGPGRLLMMDVDCWVHLNCALWSYEVFEAQDGTLFNVDKAYRNSLSSECVLCHRRGATLTCFEPYCHKVYHLQCAIDDRVAFLADKTIKCCQHSSKLSPSSIMDSLAVERLVFVDRDESRQLARLLRDEDVSGVIRMGSLIVYEIGQLLPHQMQTGNYNSTYYIYPIGFRSVRYYWSFRRLNQRCQYTCRIEDDGGHPLFVVVVTENGFDDLVVREHSCQELWRKIFDRVAKLRLQHGVVKLHSLLLVGEELFGLSDATVIRVLESMPGIELLPNYYCRNIKSSLFTLPLPVNPTGCVRSEPRLRTLYKRCHPLLNSVQRSGTSIATRTSSSAIVDFSIAQYMKQFTHSKLQQFRSLKTEWRNNVYLRRSNVQGLGLFAAREMEKHTMVIEYIGQLIRNEVSEIREKIYDQQNHGIYMFRLNDDYVIDATMAGGPARYINHSCSPNCFTEMVPTEKGDKIVIITKRKINTGEELSYDYKFDLEDEKHKIPCLCGSSNCRKWMN